MKKKILTNSSGMLLKAVFCLSIVGLLIFSDTLTAQIKLVPVARESHANSRVAEGDTLNLPFWDDFSTYEGIPDPTKWLNSDNVFINRSLALNPPTIGVATLDGATGNGGIYSSDPFKPGDADSLTSRVIDLSVIQPSEINSVFFSFFWEYHGLVEKPDDEDSLRLQFKNVENKWTTIDVFSERDFISADTFIQVIYNVEPAFFHDRFQFRFQVFGKLNGPYDAWHIDYIYLDKGRKVNEKTYFDRAISRRPSYLFKNYSAMPIDHYFLDPSSYNISSSIDIYNLDALLQPIEYSALIVNLFDQSEIIDILNLNTELNPILQGQERRTLNANLLDNSQLDPDVDSLYLQVRFYISSGDTVQANGIDYRVNDTIYTDFTLHDYYAYDDGTAEFGVGIEQKGGKMACMFILEKPDVLLGVDLYFPNIGRNQADTPFDLIVWERLSNSELDVLYRRENMTIDAITSFNEFQSIRLPELFVKDTIYIGWEQQTNEMMVVGLDKENDMGDKLFYNVDGVWNQNPDIIGSAMIRPHFGEGEEEPVGLDKRIITEIVKIYPNPANSQFYIEGSFSQGILYDLTGRVMKKIQASDQLGITEIEIYGLKPGLYLLEIQDTKNTQVEKLWIGKTGHF
ncbi:T9SS type A sorting domain-containing protein [Bacteroidota bacterium]